MVVKYMTSEGLIYKQSKNCISKKKTNKKLKNKNYKQAFHRRATYI